MEQGLTNHERSDGMLVRLARAGDRYAFDRLVPFLVAPLRGFLGRRVSRQAVDDVVQETLLAAWTALPRFEQRPHTTFDMWFYRIARNKAADWARRNASRIARETSITPADEDRLVAPDSITGVEQEAEISALLENLSTDQKTIIELYYANGLTLAEIARKLDRNLSTVKYHFYRAQETLVQARRASEEAKQ
ncbi:MAG: RNA polymerase sigma factor [Akkermansiaceae bacterium]|nr:RNA polymerase sigma factor [Armatimonadota bacterium]